MSSTPNWAAMLAAAAEAGGDRAPGLKAALPLAYVLERWNYPVVAEGDELRAQCPFHDDTNPSLTIYKREEGERYKCFSCGAGGDVFDLVKRLAGGETFGAVLDTAEELLAAMQAEEWVGPELGVKRPFDFEAAREYVQAAEVRSPEAVYALLNGKADRWLGLSDVNAAELIEWWGLGSSGEWTVIPYYRRDRSLVTYKRRRPDTTALAAAGSDFSDVLYGEWLDTDPSRPVILTEGESDAWAAWAVFGTTHAVLSIPTGAAAHPKPEQVEGLRGRRVTVAFDGDDAGRAGALRWALALRQVDAQVTIAPLAEGADLAGLPPSALAEVVEGALSILSPPPELTVINGEWHQKARGKSEEHQSIANWSFKPTRVLVGERDAAYEGVLLPHGRTVTLRTSDLASRKDLAAWSTAHQVTWSGSDTAASWVQRQLQAETVFMPRGRMVTVAGYHRRHFVWPGGFMGPTEMTYVEPPIDVHLADQLRIEAAPFDPALPLRLRQLHRRDVMDPILAWLAVAPLRAMFKGGFPVLAVTGSSGSGKTTLLETVVRAFSGSSVSLNLTGTTQLPIFAHAGATNAFPLWVDEYRPGARKDTKEMFDQVLRDAYMGQASAKGGMGTHWGEVKSLPALAPIVVSGEDAFTETSHLDRMIPVPLPRDGRNPDALAWAQAHLDSGFAYDYLAWLLFSDDNPDADRIIVRPEPIPGLSDRMRRNVAILRHGWGLLRGYLLASGLPELDEPDFTRVIAQLQEDAASEPLLDALRWVAGEPQQDAVRDDGENLWVVPEALVAFVNRNHGIVTLPGGVKAIRARLQEPPFSGVRANTRAWGMQRKAYRIDRSVLGEVE